MSVEDAILTAAVVISVISLAFTPRNKLFELQFILLFVQLPTWLLGLTVVELGWLEYPHRELADVNRTSFIFEYIFLPVLCVHVNNHYPWQASTPVKTAYLTGIGLIITGVEVLFERHTMLIQYTSWKWYWTLFSVMFIFWLTQKTIAWFFRSP
ncbi:CBO0543 family protein [Anaeroselena agilis]|uniref:CBO0543 family protein n=1 Tax=Anaeroselena agilis TaxID=3063788 RepID=A0ABU3P1P1_9FIRM|nr:CBO0543 family protein [Selenomonadales bacterium 4137-cl]